MIINTASSGVICLRCQFRLAYLLRRPKAFSIPRRGSQIRRNGTENSHEAAVSSSRTEITPEAEDGESVSGDGRPPLRRVAADRPQGPGLRAAYHSRGQRLLAQEEILPIDILGQAAHAIVMREGGVWQTRKPVPEEVVEQVSNRLDDVFDALDRERRDLTAEEVQKNIDELRPAQDAVLTRGEFDLLKETLVRGFTTPQLNAYVRDKASEGQAHTASEEARFPWILCQSPWKPEVGLVDEIADHRLQGYVTKSATPKEKLVVSLMRQRWGISIQELLEGHGVLEVQVQEVEFNLLLVGTRRWLQTISRSTLKPGKQIELIRSRNLIRIVASKATAEMILDNINAILQSKITKTIDPTLITPRRIESKALEDLGKITSAYLRYGASDKELLVSWINVGERDPNVEDAADKVFRLLLTAPVRDERSAWSVHVHGYSNPNGRLIPDGSNGKWPWKERVDNKGRWIAPVARPGGSDQVEWIPCTVLKHGVEPTAEVDSSQVPGFVEQFSWKQSSSTTSAAWPVVATKFTTAVFGHILHSFPPSAPRASPVFTKKPPTTNPGILSPVMPPLMSLVFSDQLCRRGDGTILLRFVPDPSQPGDASLPPHASAPPLELRIVTYREGDDVVTSLRVITAVHTADVLQPRRPVDVRVTQTAFFELPSRALGLLAAPAVEFLERSSLRHRDARLETPARLPGLMLPRRFLTGASMPDASYASKAAGVHDEELVRVDYLFAGLEVHRALATPYDGWRLVLTNIEAGQGGGSRAELSLESTLASPPLPAQQQQPHQPVSPFEHGEPTAKDGEAPGDVDRLRADPTGHFMRVVSRLSDGVGFCWCSPAEKDVGSGV